MQAIGAQTDHQLLRRHRQALILQTTLMAQAVRLFTEQRIPHQRGEFLFRQRQHQIFHRRQVLNRSALRARARDASCLACGSRAS